MNLLSGTRTLKSSLGQILGARVLAEFGDDPNRYADAKARRNHFPKGQVLRCRCRRSVPGTTPGYAPKYKRITPCCYNS